MFAGLECGNGNGSMHVIGNTDADGIDLRIGQQVVVISVGLGYVVGFGFFSQTVGQNIAQGDHFSIFDLGIVVGMDGTDRADTDDTDLDFVTHKFYSLKFYSLWIFKEKILLSFNLPP